MADRRSPRMRKSTFPRSVSVQREEKELSWLFQKIFRAVILGEFEKACIDDMYFIKFGGFLMSKKNHIKLCSLIRSTPEGLRRCLNSDKKLVSALHQKNAPCYHYCHAGLVDFGFPLRVREVNIPAVVGQFLFSPPVEQAKARIAKNISDLPLAPGPVEKALDAIPAVSLKTLKSMVALINHVFKKSPEEAVLTLAKLDGIDSPKFEKLQKIIQYLKENYSKRISISELSEEMSISPYYLEHIFKEKMGMPVIKYLNCLRVEAAKDALQNTSLPVTRIAFSLGWNDSNYFSNMFKRETGLSPSSYRKAFREQ